MTQGSPTHPVAGARRVPHGAEPRAPRRAKRGGTGAVPEAGEMVVPVPLPLDIVHAFHGWIASRPEPKPDLPRAIRFALREWLTARELRRHLGQANEESAAKELPGL